MTLMAKVSPVFALALTILVSTARAADAPELSPAVKTVCDHYMKIHAALAADTLKGVGENARAIAKIVRADESKTLPAAMASQADALARSHDLAPARDAFKSLSASLVKYFSDHPAPKGTIHEVYCPMAQASWLQTNTEVSNPYMGKDMASCGVVKN